MKTLTEAEMLHRAAAYCTAAERCIQDVEKKIAAAGLPADAAERIINRLVTERFIDENRFCQSFVNDKIRFNRWGRIKIAYELQKRHIPAELRREALENIDEAAYRAILLKLLKEKKRTIKGKDSRDIFQKLLRFAAGRGFESQEALCCLKQLFNGEECDNAYDEDLE